MKNYLRNCAFGALVLIAVVVIVGVLFAIPWLSYKLLGDSWHAAAMTMGLYALIIILGGGFVPNTPPGYYLPPPRPKPPPNNHKRN